MHKKTALIYSDEYSRCSYGKEHPFKMQRFRLAYELMTAYGLTGIPNAQIVTCEPAVERDLLSFHSHGYLEKLKEFNCSDEPRADFRYGLGDTDNPVFRGLYDWACLSAGGTLQAARLVAEEGCQAAFNFAGGWHHAHRDRASGFSYLNDCVVAIKELLGKGKRVVYLDLDAHHCDGVQDAFYDTDQVLTISLHESGICFFPGTGSEQETGNRTGKGFTVNIPLAAHTDDTLFMKAFDEVAFPLIAAYDPDIMVTQLGADTFRTDPLTRLEITTHGYSYIMRKLKSLCIPWVAVGGGGYEILNVARAWTIAWAVMNDVELEPRLPESFIETIRGMGFADTMLPDAVHRAEPDDRDRALHALEQRITTIKREVFPVIFG